MPPPNAAAVDANAAASKTPPKKPSEEKKTAELGARLAKSRSQDFKSKIEGWNDTGAGIVDKKDAGSSSSSKAEPDVPKISKSPAPQDESRPIKPKDPSPGTKLNQAVPPLTPKKLGREFDLERRAWVRKKIKTPPKAAVKADVDVADELRQATTPRKRIVSDGHWRRDRPPKPDPAAIEDEPTPLPKPVVIRRSVATIGMRVPPSIHDIRTIPGMSYAGRRVVQKSRSPSPDYQDSGVKVYIHRRRKQSEQPARAVKDSDASTTAESSLGTYSTITDITVPSQRSGRKSTPRRSPPTRERRIRRSPAPDDEVKRSVGGGDRKRRSRTPEFDRDDPPRPKTADQARDLSPAVIPHTERITHILGNRVEGWLAGTSDPFNDRSDSSLTPKPLNLRRTKTPRTDSDGETSVQDQRDPGPRRRRSRSADTIDLRERLIALKHNQDRSLRSSLEDVSPPLSATPTLKRSGARRVTHSPLKERGTTIDQNSRPRAKSAHLSNDSKPLSRKDDPAQRRSRTQTQMSDLSVQSYTNESVDSRDTGELDKLDVKQHSPSRRRLTKHSDLMSVLSLPQETHEHKLVPARSIRRRASGHDGGIEDLMAELAEEELEYQRELRTLVDGVIPVLLNYVLQNTPTSAAKKLLAGSSDGSAAVTRPIVEMGVALERLKSIHKRIPQQTIDLFDWAQRAIHPYTDYLKTWRLGFEDLVVNLAPVDETNPKDGPRRGGPSSDDDKSNQGERVKVAYLLKRPLVRLKNLSRLFKSIAQLQPSTKADEQVSAYQKLVDEARQRVAEERARLEDEAAASVDATRARDTRTLVRLAGVSIDPTRRVRARDCFDLELTHTTGQQIGCKIELILRDDAPNRGSSGDVLFCEISPAGSWLLFPPIGIGSVSARRGDQPDELIIMIRGSLVGGREWREVMSCRTTDDAALSEWLDMLGTSPVPAKLERSSSFNAKKKQPKRIEANPAPLPRIEEVASTLSSPSSGSSRTEHIPLPNPTEVDVPIGEQATSESQLWDASEVNSVSDYDPPNLRAPRPTPRHAPTMSTVSTDSYEQVYARITGRSSGARDRHPTSRPHYQRSMTNLGMDSTTSTMTKDYSVWLPSQGRQDDRTVIDDDDDDDIGLVSDVPPRPPMHRRTSSVPSSDLPTIAKIRQSPAPPSTPEGVDSDRSRFAPTTLPKGEPDGVVARSPQPSTIHNPSTSRSSGELTLRTNNLTTFTPAFLQKGRRTSSPLKHEYDPSTASELSESEDSVSDDEEDSISSESSHEQHSENISVVGDLKGFQNYTQRPYVQPVQPKPAIQPTPPTDESLGPSDSASQGPYRRVPSDTAVPSKTVASMFTWSNEGRWAMLHPEECCIIVTPGLIEAFDLAQAQAVVSATENQDDGNVSPSKHGVRPLVALELTPLVPLRRGTALDISIRSPPTPKSLIRVESNVMFRSRNAEECEQLYGLINRARIDNPTWIALQHARGPQPTSNWGAVMDRNNAARTLANQSSSSWWHLGSRKSYRSKGTRPGTASVTATDSSIGTQNSAFSALRRFSGSRMFNIAKSTLTSREGTRSSTSDSILSSGGLASPASFDPSMGTPVGLNHAKIRCYFRESAAKWRDMGAARLTVLIPPNQDPIVAATPGARRHKRVLVLGKSHGETLLDVTLGEDCFERVARTGIAVSVWQDDGHVGAVGGVNSARSRVYMLQMRSEREAAFTFGLVGKLRY